MRHLGWSIMLAASAASGQSAPTPVAPNPMAGLQKCRTITAPSERLACYDAASASIDTAIARHDLTVLDKQEVRQTRRSLFGFSLPNLKVFGLGSDEKKPEFTELDGMVKSVRMVAYGKYDITIDDGAVWRNIDLLDSPPPVGKTIHLSHTPVGGFLMKVPFSPSVHATRIR